MNVRFKRGLYLMHRWAGIGLCAFLAMWFFSGVVMMYVGYPKLTPQERRSALPALNAAGVRIDPLQALNAAGVADPLELSLAASRAGLPVYRITPARGPIAIVDAASGQRAAAADATVAQATARAYFAGRYTGDYAGTLEEDVFTHSGALDRHRPLHRIDMHDPAQTRLYVSSMTGEVVLDATRTERGWNYVGAWIHWLYPLRGNRFDGYWHQIVVWLSVAGVVLTITGSIVGILRWRFSRPYASGSRSPYREPFMHWHHALGLAFAAITFTWIFSGLMSMNPWKVFSSDAPPLDVAAYRDARLDRAKSLTPLAAVEDHLRDTHAAPIKELTWTVAAGQPFLLAQAENGRPAVFDGVTAAPATIDATALRAAAARLRPHASIQAIDILPDYDTYYYAREAHAMLGHVEKPLPIWRVTFDDAQATWVYIDPHTGRIVQQTDARKRVGRWLFAFLHSWDALPLLTRRPLWDIVLIVLSVGGFALSATGVVIGWRRVKRKVRSHDRTASSRRR
ncbi:PepSY domain-containing protein [Schauerella aestuarii]|uniref:PepSY domain-containing protein n=1 Tax=Schauerella aestuarii TaxID=2511204 RepID=UPI00136FEEDE|nr:PepSY domain-containing protein [Achromobacter aestuarii]MYZ43593.1 PepSY domain-containing protein [Achromobacter aestuarii]